MDRRLIVRAALVLAAAACDRAGGGAPPRDGPGGLEGSWALELRLERPAQLRTDTAAVAPIRGEVALLGDSLAGRPDGGLPVHYGSHTLDVRPFGISLRGSGRVPTVVARRVGADSVELTLDPGAPGGGVTLAGRLAGDAAAGRWWWHGPGRSASASGRFVLRRK